MLIAYHVKKDNIGWQHIITAESDNHHAWRTDQDQWAINHLQNTGCSVITMGASMWQEVTK
jgi:hypothetical protein